MTPQGANAPSYAADTDTDTDSAVPVLSVAPVVLPAPDRPVDLSVRVSAPVSGSGLSIVLLSGGAHAVQLDVTDQASITAAAERVQRDFGRPSRSPSPRRSSPPPSRSTPLTRASPRLR